MKKKNGFVLREVCGEKVIVGEGVGAVNFGKLISLNETAAFLWRHIGTPDGDTVESLAEKLCQEYDVAPDEALDDVRQVTNEWKQLGVIEQ